MRRSETEQLLSIVQEDERVPRRRDLDQRTAESEHHKSARNRRSCAGTQEITKDAGFPASVATRVRCLRIPDQTPEVVLATLHAEDADPLCERERALVEQAELIVPVNGSKELPLRLRKIAVSRVGA